MHFDWSPRCVHLELSKILTCSEKHQIHINFLGISTGKYHAAHLTNDENMEELCRHAGKVSGDLSFPLVYSPELQFPEFASDVADMKNSVAVS